MQRTLLVLLLGLGFTWAGDLSQAHGQQGQQGRYPRVPPGATELPPGYPPVPDTPSRQPLRDWCRYGRPLGCWASFNGYGCSSLESEIAFVFGSCRTFFGEPCLKGAPPSPLPPWAGTESGYRNNHQPRLAPMPVGQPFGAR